MDTSQVGEDSAAHRGEAEAREDKEEDQKTLQAKGERKVSRRSKQPTHKMKNERYPLIGQYRSHW